MLLPSGHPLGTAAEADERPRSPDTAPCPQPLPAQGMGSSPTRGSRRLLSPEPLAVPKSRHCGARLALRAVERQLIPAPLTASDLQTQLFTQQLSGVNGICARGHSTALSYPAAPEPALWPWQLSACENKLPAKGFYCCFLNTIFFLKYNNCTAVLAIIVDRYKLHPALKRPRGAGAAKPREAVGIRACAALGAPSLRPPGTDVLTGGTAWGLPVVGLTLRIHRVQGPAPDFAAPLRAGTRGARVRGAWRSGQHAAPTAAVLAAAAARSCTSRWCVMARAGRGTQSCFAAAPPCVCHCRVLLCPQNTLQSPRVLCLQRAPLQRINKP